MPKFTPNSSRTFTFLDGSLKNPYLTDDVKVFLILRFVKDLGVNINPFTGYSLLRDITGYSLPDKLRDDYLRSLEHISIRQLALALDTLGFKPAQVARMTGTSKANISYAFNHKSPALPFESSVLAGARKSLQPDQWIVEYDGTKNWL